MSVNRESLKTVGNMNGNEILCENCGEPFENAWIVDEASQEELNNDVIYGNYPDDPDGDDKTCIIGLHMCGCCN